MSSKSDSSGGIGLKLTDNIDWSWWWVMSPLWIPISIIIVIAVVVVIVQSFRERW